MIKQHSITESLRLLAHVLCLPLWIVVAALLYTTFQADRHFFMQKKALELQLQIRAFEHVFAYTENTDIDQEEKSPQQYLLELYKNNSIDGLQIIEPNNTFWHIYKNETLPEKATFSDTRSINEYYQSGKINNRPFILYQAKLPVSKAEILIYNEIQKDSILFRSKWVLIVFIIAFLFATHLLLLKKQGEEILELIYSGLNKFLYDGTPELNQPKATEQISKPSTEADTEIINLQEKLQVFTETSKQRILLLQLSLNLQKILNIPNQLLPFYLDEFYFLCRNLSENLHWEIVNDVEKQEIEHVLEIPIEAEYQEHLFKQTGQKKLLLSFKRKAPQEELTNIFKKYFALLVKKSFLEEKKRELQAMQKELELSRKVQNSLLPTDKTITNKYFNLECFTLFDNEPTGDFFNIITFKNTCHIYVADISRKDTGAILIAIYLKSFFESIARELSLPGFILSQANAYLCRSKFENAFVTIFYCTVDLHTQTLQYASAGHNRMFLKRQQNVMNLSSNNIPIGIQAEHNYQTKTIALYKNDVLFVYSYALLYHLQQYHSNLYISSQNLQNLLQGIHLSTAENMAKKITQEVYNNTVSPPPLIGPNDMTQIAMQIL